MGKSKSLFFLDSLIVLLNIAAGRGNILLYWLTGLESHYYIQAIVIFIDLLYITFRFSYSRGKTLIRLPKSVIVIVLLLFVNLINIILEGRANPLAQFIYFTLIILFVFLLQRLSNEYLKTNNDNNDTSRFLFRGYKWLSLISIVGVFLSFILINTIGQDLSPVNADFMAANLDRGETYYRSYFSVNMFALIPRVPFFQEHGLLSGLFHETHLMAFNVMPCLILMLGYSRNTITRWAIAITAVLVLLFAGSATCVIVVGACLILFLVINSRKRLIGSIIAAAAIALLVIAYISIDDTFLEFFLGRLDEGSGSQQYSVSLLEWTFSPRTLMGTDFFSTQYVEAMQISSVITKDVGFIPFFLNIAFILFYLRDTAKLVLTHDRIGKAVGFASLYLILHSAKIGMTLFAQTLPLLMIYLQTVTLRCYGRNKNT